MNTFPSIFEWLERLDFLRGLPAAYLLLLAGLIVVVVWDWRAALLALTSQYLLASLLFVEVLEPRLVIVKLFVGLFVSLMLYFTARQAIRQPRLPQERLLSAQEDGSRHVDWRALLNPEALAFRLLLSLLLVALVLWLSDRPGYQLPAVPAAVTLAIYGLAGLGLLATTVAPTPLRAGMGLLTTMLGFELFYNSLDQSVTILVVLAVVNLTIALAIAYLEQVRAHSCDPLPVPSD
jgi:hypothetical protein